MFKCNAFPLLDSYEKARAHFENVKPMMRGDYKGVKPIHLRSRPTRPHHAGWRRRGVYLDLRDQPLGVRDAGDARHPDSRAVEA
jgi:hypothetical protein